MKQAAQSRGSRAPAPLGRSRCELLCRRRQLGPRPLTHTQLCSCPHAPQAWPSAGLRNAAGCQTESTSPRSCAVPELPLHILNLLPHPLPANWKETQHALAPRTPPSLPGRDAGDMHRECGHGDRTGPGAPEAWVLMLWLCDIGHGTSSL